MAILREHIALTGSEPAERALEDLARFTKLVPREYSLVTAALEAAKVNGLDITNATVWSDIMEASHG